MTLPTFFAGTRQCNRGFGVQAKPFAPRIALRSARTPLALRAVNVDPEDERIPKLSRALESIGMNPEVMSSFSLPSLFHSLTPNSVFPLDISRPLSFPALTHDVSGYCGHVQLRQQRAGALFACASGMRRSLLLTFLLLTQAILLGYAVVAGKGMPIVQTPGQSARCFFELVRLQTSTHFPLCARTESGQRSKHRISGLTRACFFGCDRMSV